VHRLAPAWLLAEAFAGLTGCATRAGQVDEGNRQTLQIGSTQ
jgi:hypothetical protein